MRRTLFPILTIAIMALAPHPGAAKEKAIPQIIKIRVVAAEPTKSAEGFVDTHNLGEIDSARDLADVLRKTKCWHPKDKTKKAMPDLREICFAFVETGEDVTVTVAKRGVNQETLGQRTTMSLYQNVVVAESVPTVGVTRWVSIIISAGTYKKEVLAYYANKSKWSLGAWKNDAKLLGQQVADWMLLNQAKFRPQ
jgi:hypothetical protein